MGIEKNGKMEEKKMIDKRKINVGDGARRQEIILLFFPLQNWK